MPPETPSQGAWEAVWQAITDYCEAERGNATFVAAEAAVDAALTAHAATVAAEALQEVQDYAEGEDEAALAHHDFSGSLIAQAIASKAARVRQALRAPADEGGKTV